MTGPRVTLADVSHAALCAGLHALCFPPAEAWGPQAMTELLVTPGTQGFLVWSADDAEEPDGLALVRMTLDEAEILTFGLRPEARGRGQAARLLQSIVAALAAGHVRSLFLEVAVDNIPARTLYSGHGFFEIGRRVGYYDRGQGRRVDALRLRLAIDGEPDQHDQGIEQRERSHGPNQ